MDESDPESSFPQLLLLAIIILWSNEISSPSFNLAIAKLCVVPPTLGAGTLLPHPMPPSLFIFTPPNTKPLGTKTKHT